MEVSYSKKAEKHQPLSLAIVSNGWLIHLFPIEVGDRGYCSAIVKTCIMRLGFMTNLIKSTLKSLCLTSSKASFQIWLSPKSKKWENVITPF